MLCRTCVLLTSCVALAADSQPRDETSLLQLSSKLSVSTEPESLLEEKSAPTRGAVEMDSIQSLVHSVKAASSEQFSTEDIAFMHGQALAHQGASKEMMDLKMKPDGTLVWSPKIHTHIWGDMQCNSVGNRNGGSVEACKDLCILELACNAFNFNSATNDCVLRACPMPIPNPAWTYPGYTGYHLELHHDKQVAQNLPVYDDTWDHADADAVTFSEVDISTRMDNVEKGLLTAESEIGTIQKAVVKIDGDVGLLVAATPGAAKAAPAAAAPAAASPAAASSSGSSSASSPAAASSSGSSSVSTVAVKSKATALSASSVHRSMAKQEARRVMAEAAAAKLSPAKLAHAQQVAAAAHTSRALLGALAATPAAPAVAKAAAPKVTVFEKPDRVGADGYKYSVVGDAGVTSLANLGAPPNLVAAAQEKQQTAKTNAYGGSKAQAVAEAAEEAAAEAAAERAGEAAWQMQQKQEEAAKEKEQEEKLANSF